MMMTRRRRARSSMMLALTSAILVDLRRWMMSREDRRNVYNILIRATYDEIEKVEQNELQSTI